MTSFAKSIIIVWFLAILTGCSLREINISGHDSPSPDQVLYLLVDKAESVGNMLVFVNAVNDIKLDLVKGPCVYIIKSGPNRVSYSTSKDFQPDGTYLIHALDVTTDSGKYYHLLPSQNSTDDLRLTEIEKDKIKEAYDKQPPLLEIILFFKG